MTLAGFFSPAFSSLRAVWVPRVVRRHALQGRSIELLTQKYPQNCYQERCLHASARYIRSKVTEPAPVNFIRVRIKYRRIKILINDRQRQWMMSFVSAREQRKREAKEMREEVLREAKESFEKQRKREELKRARGEDTWIVPAVKKRLGFKGEASHSSEKKKRKKKKEKKHKKHKVSSKVEKNQNGSESDSNESEGEEMWVEMGNSAPSTNEIETSRYQNIHFYIFS